MSEKQEPPAYEEMPPPYMVQSEVAPATPLAAAPRVNPYVFSAQRIPVSPRTMPHFAAQVASLASLGGSSSPRDDAHAAFCKSTVYDELRHAATHNNFTCAQVAVLVASTPEPFRLSVAQTLVPAVQPSSADSPDDIVAMIRAVGGDQRIAILQWFMAAIKFSELNAVGILKLGAVLPPQHRLSAYAHLARLARSQQPAESFRIPLSVGELMIGSVEPGEGGRVALVREFVADFSPKPTVGDEMHMRLAKLILARPMHIASDFAHFMSVCDFPAQPTFASFLPLMNLADNARDRVRILLSLIESAPTLPRPAPLTDLLVATDLVAIPDRCHVAAAVVLKWPRQGDEEEEIIAERLVEQVPAAHSLQRASTLKAASEYMGVISAEHLFFHLECLHATQRPQILPVLVAHLSTAAGGAVTIQELMSILLLFPEQYRHRFQAFSLLHPFVIGGITADDVISVSALFTNKDHRRACVATLAELVGTRIELEILLSEVAVADKTAVTAVILKSKLQ